jgi:regulator of protease activity HflC (stomatin/prohibitin superfamily)
MFVLFRRLQVMEYQKAVLYEDGRYVKTLGPGRYWLNRVYPRQETTLVDVRLASLAVAGQEVLTADKLAVRLTLVAQYRVADPAKAMTLVQNFVNYLYEELQLAMRDIVGAQTLDGLLARKGALSDELAQKVRPRVAAMGLELVSCGVKDVVLPGEIKTLLIKTAEAERTAQAALITAREELAATRCQANTAKLIADNPSILRLKELQVMTEFAKKSGNTFVFGSAPWTKP